MATLNQSSQEALCAEILAEARHQGEQLVQRAQQDADALLARTATEAEKAKEQSLQLARSEATRRKALILATVPVEAVRLRAARIETLLEAIYTEARRRLAARSDFDYRKTLVMLAAEAISGMAGDAFIVKLSSADHAAFGVGLAEDIALRAGRSSVNIIISDDPTITECGVIVQDAEGRQVWDNRLLERLERLWPELRRQIAVQSSLVAEDVAAGASRFANRTPLATKSPASPACLVGASRDGREQRGDGEAGHISTLSPIPITSSGGAK